MLALSRSFHGKGGTFTLCSNLTFSLIFCSLLSVHCSLFTVLCSLFTVCCSLFTVYCSLFTVHCSLFAVHCLLFTVHCLLFTVHCSLVTCYFSLFNIFASLVFFPCSQWCDDMMLKTKLPWHENEECMERLLECSNQVRLRVLVVVGWYSC